MSPNRKRSRVVGTRILLWTKIVVGALAFATTSQAQQPALQISSPQNGSIVNPGQTLSVTVISPNGTTFSEVAMLGPDPIGFNVVGTSTPAQFSIAIPSDADCRVYTLTADGVTSSGQGVTSSPIQIDVERPDLPILLSTPVSDVILESEGMQRSLVTLATFSDGTIIDVSESTLMSYTSTNTSVVTVDATGHVTAVGTGSAAVSIIYTRGSNSVQLTLQVQVLSQALSASPSSIAFPGQATGTTSAAQSLALTNSSAGPVTILSLATTGDFSESDNCIASSPLAVGGRCTANVTFSPAAAGQRTGTLNIANSANLVPISISLSGTATTAPAITSLSPTSGSVGSSVTISGANFGATQGTSTVTFSGTPATATTWSATSIVTPVPAGATTGSVVVTVGGVPSNGVTFTVANRPIAYVQGNSGNATSQVVSQSVPYTAAQTAGDLNVVVVGWIASSAQVQSVTDTAGNNYSLAVGPTVLSADITQQSIYYAKNIKGAAANANSVTVAFSSSVLPDIRIAEYSGLDTANPLDVSAGQPAFSSGSATTTSAPDLLVGAGMASKGPLSPGPGYTSRLLTSQTQDILEDEVVSSSGPESATATINAPNGCTRDSPCYCLMQMVAFRAPH